MCTDAYRAALTQDFRLRPQPQENDPERRGDAAAGTTAGSGQPVALAEDAGIGDCDAIDQR